MFEFNFRDERYLPFEGAGAVGRWRLELPSEYPQFDYNTIADVVLHVRYTAREGGGQFKAAVQQGIDNNVNALVTAVNQQGLFHFISMKHEFGTAFHQFLNPVGAADHQTTITLSKQHFPYLFQGKDIAIQNLIVFLKLQDASLHSDNDPLQLTISRDGSTELQSLATAGSELGDLAHGTYTQLSGSITGDENWEFSITQLPAALRQTVNIDGTSVERIKSAVVKDLGILVQYEVS